MALETLSANELLNFIIYDAISATPFPSTASCNVDNSSENAITTVTTSTTTSPNVNTFPLDCEVKGFGTAVAQMVVGGGGFENCSSMVPPPAPPLPPPGRQQNLSAVQGRKKRRRRQRVCKNKEEAENQRMTHIAVERNRRKQMNEHLAVLRSLMPESYVQRGDQASIVGGAIEFVKELEHHLQTLEAQKIQLMQQQTGGVGANDNPSAAGTAAAATAAGCATTTTGRSPFAQFFAYPQFTCSSASSSSSSSAGQLPMKFTSSSKAAIADIEVTLIETHANVRILSRRRVRQLSKLVTGLQSMYLSILHLNVTTLDPLVLYSISAKVEEGCLLNSADDIAAAVHHILRIIEEEAHLCCEA